MSCAVFIRAVTSLGKQLPPYPHPGYRKLWPILESLPIPLRTLSIFAPILSHIFAISFIKDILFASIEFDAYFVISALRTSIIIILSWFLVNGSYNSFIISAAESSSVPTITLSGCIKSFTAVPSFRNSGFETTVIL